MVVTQEIHVEAQGYCDFHNITPAVAEAVRRSEIQNGIVTVFTPSATSALTTIEFESGALADLAAVFEQIAPQDSEYEHNKKWRDGNGFSHVRAALMGPSLSVPIVAGKLTLGTWQQITFIDFDNRPRSRRLIAQVVGE